MTGILEAPLQALQQYRPFIDGIVLGSVFILVVWFCIEAIRQGQDDT